MALAIIFLASVFIFALIYEMLKKRHDFHLEKEFLTVAEVISPKYKGFSDFYNLYKNDRNKFLTRFSLSHDVENFDLENLKPIEVLYIFANAKNLVHLVDWKGEENEGEIEAFIDGLLKQQHSWTQTLKLRNDLKENKAGQSQFIIELFQSVDKDLQATDNRLIFFELNWDAYVFTVVASKIFDDITGKRLTEIHGVDKLQN